MPLVSVIMPSYNHERYISEAIESVLTQTFTDLELIIIDDASKDNSRQIIEGFSKKDGRIKAIFHERNMGIARTLNDGIERAKGKFITFIASDDVWIKDKLEKQVRVLEENEDLVVWAEAEIIDANGNSTGEVFTQKYHPSARKKSGDIFEELLIGDFMHDRILKRENLGDIRFNEALKYLNDHQFDVDLASKYEYCFIPEPLVRYRRHGTNTTLSYGEVGWLKEQIIIGEYFLRKYSNKISKEVKSGVYLRMGLAHLRLGDKAKAGKCLYYGGKLSPSLLIKILWQRIKKAIGWRGCRSRSKVS